MSFKEGSFDIQGISSIANQRIFVAAEGAIVKAAAPSDGGSVQVKRGRIVEPDLDVADVGKDWDLEGIITAKEVETSKLRGNMRAFQGMCRAKSAEVSADMLAVVALAEQCLDLEFTVSKLAQALDEVEWKLQVVAAQNYQLSIAI